MKKTLIAMAVMAAAGAASAQVTLYGKLDYIMQSEKTTTSGATAADKGLEVNSAGLNSSRWGMKGTEDLGGGLKASFKYEAGVSADTGAFNAGGFNRASNLSLAGGFGSFTMGRQVTPYDDALGGQDAQDGGHNQSALGAVFGGGKHSDNVRQSNSLRYDTPSFGGFQAALMYAPGEDGDATKSAGNYTGLSLVYATGPVYVSLGAEDFKAAGGATTNAWVLGGTYDFGAAKVGLTVGRASNNALDPVDTTKDGGNDKGFGLSVSVPVSGALTVDVGYARETKTLAANDASADTTGYSVVGHYALSKRTKVYGALFNTDNTAAATQATTNVRRYGVGIQHNF